MWQGGWALAFSAWQLCVQIAARATGHLLKEIILAERDRWTETWNICGGSKNPMLGARLEWRNTVSVRLIYRGCPLHADLLWWVGVQLSLSTLTCFFSLVWLRQTGNCKWKFILCFAVAQANSKCQLISKETFLLGTGLLYNIFIIKKKKKNWSQLWELKRCLPCRFLLPFHIFSALKYVCHLFLPQHWKQSQSLFTQRP